MTTYHVTRISGAGADVYGHDTKGCGGPADACNGREMYLHTPADSVDVGNSYELDENGAVVAAALDEADEQDAQLRARHVMEGADPDAGDWRAAGYSSALDAARVLVGDSYPEAVRERAARIVAEHLGA